MSRNRGQRAKPLEQNQNTVNEMVQAARQRQAEEQGTSDGRGIAGHGQKKYVDKRGVTKATYNLPLALIEQVSTWADRLDCPKNDLAQAALVMLCNALEQQPDMLDDFKIPSKLLRYDWRLEIPDEFGCGDPDS